MAEWENKQTKLVGRTKRKVGCLVVWAVCGVWWEFGGILAEFGGKAAGPKKAVVQPVVVSPFAGSVADEEAEQQLDLKRVVCIVVRRECV